jgi:hypothetical protein
MGWDDWDAIEAAQAKADREPRDRRGLMVVPDLPVSDAPGEPEQGPQLPAVTVDVYEPPEDQQMPRRPRVDPVAGLRAYAALIIDFLEMKRDLEDP